MAKRNVNMWDDIEPKLREVFPYPWPEKDWYGKPIKEEDREDYYESEKDPLIPFLTGREGEPDVVGDVEYVEFEGSFYENVDYDSIPQGTEDECHAIIKIGEQHYKVGLFFTSYSGYRLSEDAFKVSPKTVEVVVYD